MCKRATRQQAVCSRCLSKSPNRASPPWRVLLLSLLHLTPARLHLHSLGVGLVPRACYMQLTWRLRIAQEQTITTLSLRVETMERERDIVRRQEHATLANPIPIPIPIPMKPPATLSTRPSLVLLECLQAVAQRPVWETWMALRWHYGVPCRSPARLFDHRHTVSRRKCFHYPA